MKMSVIVMKNYADLPAMSELTQKDGKTFFCVCVTNVTGLLFACFVVTFS